MTTRRSRLALFAWMLFLVGALAATASIGHGALEAPPVRAGWHGLAAWVERRTAAEAAFAIVRVLVLGAGLYVLTTAVLQVITRSIRPTSLIALVDAMTVPAVRRLCQAAFGVTLAAGTVIAAGGMGRTALAAPTDAVVLRKITDVDPPTMIKLAPDQTTTPEMVLLPPSHKSEPPAGTGPPEADWIVAPGDSFWAVAERSLAAAWSRPPSDREVDPYWRSLIEINRSSLPDPANPNLIFPGQQFVLAPIPAAPASAFVQLGAAQGGEVHRRSGGAGEAGG